VNGDTTVETDETIFEQAALAAYPSATAIKTITVTNDDVAVAPITMTNPVVGFVGPSTTNQMSIAQNVTADGVGDVNFVDSGPKGSGSMGSLYRSQHELVFVFKHGTGKHVNNVQLGRYGRTRTNVWRYPGMNSFGRQRDELLAAHSTVKPMAMVADAIRDCSKRGALVLDPFGGSGTTIIAAERTKRRAAVIEIDPLYVDVAVRRWQAYTGEMATLRGDGRTFAQIAAARASDSDSAAQEEASHD